MSIFSSIMDKIFHAGASPQAVQPGTAPANPAVAPAAAQAAAAAAPPAASASAAGVPTAPATAPAQPVDVEAVLTDMANKKGGGGNWQSSIVDLLKLLALDSSLKAREQLAQELDVHAGANGSAEENTALHKAVMQKLAENGGKIPASLMG